MNLSHTRDFTKARITSDLHALRQFEAVKIALSFVAETLGEVTDMGLVASNLRDTFLAQQDGNDDEAREAARWLVNSACAVADSFPAE